MWSEVAEGVATEGKIWPRAAALGERLWADPPTGNCASLSAGFLNTQTSLYNADWFLGPDEVLGW